MKRVFEIEYPDDCGPLWMNKSNLLICLTNTCRNTEFTVTDVTGDGCDSSPETAGPVNPRKSERERKAVVSAVAGGWCNSKNENKTMDGDLAEAIIENVMAAIDEFSSK